MNINFKSLLGFCITIAMPAVLLLGSCSSLNGSKKAKKHGFVQLFSGNTLDGWEGDPAYWTVENGTLIGETTSSTPPLKENTFLILKKELGDFELITDYKRSSGGNSGINYRNERVEGLPYALKGYQADIDGMNHYTGQNYEERNRTTIAYRGEKVILKTSKENRMENNGWVGRVIEESLGSSDSLKSLINYDDWNECRLVVKGNRLQHYINGFLMSDVTDDDLPNRKMSGILGIQIHIGPPMKVEYKNFRIKEL